MTVLHIGLVYSSITQIKAYRYPLLFGSILSLCPFCKEIVRKRTWALLTYAKMKGAADSQWPDICNKVVCSVISPGRQLPETSKANGQMPTVGLGWDCMFNDCDSNEGKGIMELKMWLFCLILHGGSIAFLLSSSRLLNLMPVQNTMQLSIYFIKPELLGNTN